VLLSLVRVGCGNPSGRRRIPYAARRRRCCRPDRLANRPGCQARVSRPAGGPRHGVGAASRFPPRLTADARVRARSSFWAQALENLKGEDPCPPRSRAGCRDAASAPPTRRAAGSRTSRCSASWATARDRPATSVGGCSRCSTCGWP